MVEDAKQADKLPLSKDFPQNLEDVPESTLKEILNTMQDSDLFPRTGKDAPSRFWSAYERVAKQHDDEFLEKHNSDLDVLLIFAGLFSAVSSAFIVSMANTLSPQPSDTTNALLKILINKIANGTFSDQDAALPVWTGPGSTLIWIQSLAYTSLSTSLLAAVGAVLGKQWLGHFKTSRWGRGSLEERCTRRQQKLDGLKTWHFHTVISFLPILLQLSVLFFGISLAGNIWLLQPTISGVIFGTTAFGLVIYVFTVVASLTSPDCPYQTPVSTSIQRLFQHVVWEWAAFSKAFLHWLPYPLGFHLTTAIDTIIMSTARLRAYLSRIASYLRRNSRLPTEDLESTGNSYELTSKDVLNLELPPADRVPARAVKWILETSTDTEIITTAVKMVLEVEWPYEFGIAGVTDRLRNHFMACFDASNQLLPVAQSRAESCMNAIIHCCFEGGLPNPFLHSGHHGTISYFDSHGIINYRPSIHNFLVVNCVLNTVGGNALDITSLSSADRMWIAHLCLNGLYRGPTSGSLIWEAFVVDFINNCLQDLNAPHRLVADCLLSMGLMMGLKVESRHLTKLDKSAAIPTMRNSLMALMLKDLPVDALQGAMISQRALALLHPWALYLENHSADRHSKNNDISIQYLKLCIRLLELRQTMGTSQNEITTQQIGAALQLSFFFAGYKGNDLIWNFLGQHVVHSDPVRWHWSAPDWYTEARFDLLLDYLSQIFEGTDYIAIGNTYIVMASLRGSPSTPVLKNVYIQLLMHSMGSRMPVYVRYAALNAACMVRAELISMAQDNEVLRAEFSAALSSTFYFDKPTTSSGSDLYFYKERDLCYLRLLCTLVQNHSWHYHLKQYGHFDKFLGIAVTLMRDQKKLTGRWDFAAYAVYIAHIYATTNSSGIVMESEFSQGVHVYHSWPVILEALCFIFSFNFFVVPDRQNWEKLTSTDYHEALLPLIRYRDTWKIKSVTQQLIELVGRVSTLLETNPVGNSEVKDLGLKIRKLLYTSLKDMGMKDIL